MPPWQGGGEMIESGLDRPGDLCRAAACAFEAGTPPIIEAIGLGAAIDVAGRSSTADCGASPTRQALYERAHVRDASFGA